MPELYPTFEVPEMIDEEEQINDDYTFEPRFDIQVSRVRLTPTGKPEMVEGFDTYQQWCTTCLLVERYKYEAYSSDFGVELEPIIRANYPRDIAESEMRREIQEALAVNPRTLSVDQFTFNWSAETVHVQFEIESIYGSVTMESLFGGDGIA
ncbi:DUF2634 domain-containing protein [Halalkalibacter sp. AB-rgal2]|uniref:DUF2634 domain-containing protein n=1 Tax=Halalkalibacter sp. AB-rgal2 TaxID=3242695 RepID=UPI00359D55F6